MNCLHNFVVNDTPSFLSQPDRLEIIFEMCNHVIVNDLGEDSEAHAAKLIEVVILQCQDNMSVVCIVILIHQICLVSFSGTSGNRSINCKTFST
jgi:hypothetical protein